MLLLRIRQVQEITQRSFIISMRAYGWRRLNWIQNCSNELNNVGMNKFSSSSSSYSHFLFQERENKSCYSAFSSFFSTHRMYFEFCLNQNNRFLCDKIEEHSHSLYSILLPVIYFLTSKICFQPKHILSSIKA